MAKPRAAHLPTSAHNYLPKIEAIVQDMGCPAGIFDIDVAHDSWCDALNRRGFCNCDPDVRLRPGESTCHS